MKTRKITATVLFMALAFSLMACNKAPEETWATSTEKATESVTETTTEKTTTTTTKKTEATSDNPLIDPNNPNALNPLTGVQDMDPENEGKRPVGIAVGNAYNACPQRGINEADVICEYETEGGQTRLLCVFADAKKIPEIGSVRSARIVATDLMAGMNAIFISCGRNARVPEHTSAYGITHIDINDHSQYMWRNNSLPSYSRRNGWDNVLTDSEHVLSAIEDLGVQYEDEVPLLFNFVPGKSADIAKGQPCKSINVYFSTTNDDSLFEYNEQTGLYEKSEYGVPHIDEMTDEPVAFENVIVIYANSVSHAPGTADKTIDVHFEFENTGFVRNGYYASEGKIIPIFWEKMQPNDPLKIYDENGKEIEVNRGKSVICIVDDDCYEKTTIEG
ncbi:MAG: DUF3048 domain-containing protein [Clostridiales bacterium]|nr:DUF3048 domain-containing protein [Clostridiales bacterium]